MLVTTNRITRHLATKNLIFRAGPAALARIRRDGFDPAAIGTLAGASGGAKCLVLSQLDRVVAREVLPRLSGPVHLLGTSIGAWRFACYAQADPLAAIERFEEAYIEQAYSPDPDRAEITAKSREILATVLAGGAVEDILSHPILRTHVLAVRARHVAAAERSLPLSLGLAAAASLNAVSRRALGLFFERALFHDRRDPPPFLDLGGFPLQRIGLTQDNLAPAILATGSIPLVLDGVRDIPGARPGIYRDGGVIDYHLDLPLAAPDRLVFYPHFYGHLVPGWFDKGLAWRRPQPEHVDNMLIVSPSPAFVARLPGGKIPDRHDFRRYPPAERVRTWRRVVSECRALADELEEVLGGDRLAALLEAIPVAGRR